MNELQTPTNGDGQFPESRDILNAYSTASTVYDELRAPDGKVRPHWQSLVKQVQGYAVQDRIAVHDIAARKLAENGVTFVSQDSTDGSHAPWRLDLLPLLISQEEWNFLERGLEQRANLLNSILKDVYGEQKLLLNGQVPPALMFGNPQFLRPCQGLPVPEDSYLDLIAFDLARSPDGKWWVLNDRTQAPTGLGFALENRLITSHSMPEIFGSHHVRRLASFFESYNDNLLRLTRKDQPVIGVLSSGPTMETYFEHAYLARYLGYSVVEGGDLTVRDDRVYLKTVEGLKQVDLLLRRIDSEYCDPIELRTDSSTGVPSLVKAARSGNVIISNSLGSGVLENDGLNSFMPALCRHILGEDELLPDVATWWCGQPKERNYVLDRLDQLVIRSAFKPTSILNPSENSYFGPAMSSKEKDDLRQNIMKYGHNYVGQEVVSLSTAPAWTDAHTIKPAPLTLRVFAARTEDGYKLMPGGLARVSDTTHDTAPAMHRGDYSKDTWIISDSPVDTFSLLDKQRAEISVQRSGKDLPSRTADNLFWLGRYSERAEGAVRLYRSLLNRMAGNFGMAEEPDVHRLLINLLVSQKHLSKERAKKALAAGVENIEKELWKILFDAASPDGLSLILSNVQRTAEMVRERLSLDTWRIIKRLSALALRPTFRRGQELSDALTMLDDMVQQLSAFNGMVMENMTRGYGWRFLDMGRRAERAYRGVGLLSHLAVSGNPAHSDWLDILLDLADSTMTYRTRYKDTPMTPLVLDLLLSDDSNPRSAIYQFAALADHIDALPDPSETQGLTSTQKLTVGLRTPLMLADVDELSMINAKTGKRDALEALLTQLHDGLEALSDSVGRMYFIHAETQHLSGPRWSEAGL